MFVKTVRNTAEIDYAGSGLIEANQLATAIIDCEIKIKACKVANIRV